MANAKYGMPYKSAICRLAELRLGLNKFLIGWWWAPIFWFLDAADRMAIEGKIVLSGKSILSGKSPGFP